MALKDQQQRPQPAPQRTGLFESREDQFIVLAGVVITTGVLYDVYRRQTRGG
ncbi:hypothetical protein [Halorussus lipolyticus]|uniref:hypothetical protein n=1 Tax=Halorussus lipolyticus TaxID=3034024 RepID=UPI0023E7DB75|nr:hypothetical protein [Halorussus sp. DT80]